MSLNTSEYTAQVSITDNLNRYNHLLKDITIPKGATGTLSLPPLKMVTASGTGCKGSSNEATCWSSMTRKIGTVNMIFKDAYTLNTIPHLEVNFRYTRSKYGDSVSKSKTDQNGKISFAGLYYGFYNFDTTLVKYLAHSASFKLDTATLDLEYFVVPDKGNAMSIRLNVEKSNYDVDLMLHIKSKNGSACTVSPVNKYCAYAQYMSDVGKNQSGIESIAIGKTTVSYYMALAVRNDNNVNGTCAANMCQSEIKWFTS